MSLQCLQNVLDDVELPEFQLTGIESVLRNKKMLLAFDTGTGKTFTYAGIVRALLNRNPDGKHILVIINDSIRQVPMNVSELTGVEVIPIDGQASSVKLLRSMWGRGSVFCLTLESFRQFGVAKHLFDHLPEVESFVVDEAHHVANWLTSDTAFMVRALAQYAPYVVGMTATPITSDTKQYYRLMNLLDRNLSSRRDETYLGKYRERYLSVNRSDYGLKGNYSAKLIMVEPMLHQMGKLRGNIFKALKGTGAVNQVDTLLSVLGDHLSQGRKILVYIHYHDSREWVERHLKASGTPYTALNGRVIGRDARQEVTSLFTSGQVNVLLTSVSESLNIDADVVIFYEFTASVKQVIGRAHRGLLGKNLEIDFIITRESAEVDFFIKYIYRRSLSIQKLLGKDYSELIAVGEELERRNNLI